MSYKYYEVIESSDSVQVLLRDLYTSDAIGAACAQCFAPWQQATIKIMRRNLSYYCLLTLCV